ncbi:MAG TPA: MFS transporter [Polyangiaceae bacterium]|nr:MFS transporter [Polyangiaceae bacterium]
MLQTSHRVRDFPGRARAALGFSVLEGSLYAVMVGVAESYLGAFAVELHYGPREQGLLATVPLVCGAICQLFSPGLCGRLGSRKRVALVGAIGQTLSMAALLLIALFRDTSFPALLAARVGFWVSGGVLAPAWNAWMADLTAHTDRARYFARRSAINQLALLLAFCGAGWALWRAGLHVLPCFTVLFWIAFMARFASVGVLALQADVQQMELQQPDVTQVSAAQAGAPPAEVDAQSSPCAASLPLCARLQMALETAQFRVALYLALLAFGTQIAAPFFTPYMLQDLKLDYKTYAGLAALSILAKGLTFPLCHRTARRLGLETVLRWGGVGVALIPLVWACSSSLPTLLFAHTLGGVVWAAVEYASFQLLMESAPRELTAEFFSLSSAFTGVAQVAGALAGGFLLANLHAGYGSIFLISGLLRIVPLALLFAVVMPQHWPSQLRWLLTRLRAIELSPAPNAARLLLSASELPRAMGTRSTNPPPAL